MSSRHFASKDNNRSHQSKKQQLADIMRKI